MPTDKSAVTKTPKQVAVKAEAPIKPLVAKAAKAPKVKTSTAAKVTNTLPSNTKTAKVIPKIAAKPAKVKKPKMVRDSLTMPKPEYEVLDLLKTRATSLQTHVKKTELIRAGIKVLAAMTDAAFLSAIRQVPSLKTGRPKKS
jgi:hypothetical protein